MLISLLVQATATRVQFAGRCEDLSPYREAMCEWCSRHGIDPDRVPLYLPIIRDEDERTVTVQYLQPNPAQSRGRGGYGPAELVTVQLEAPPLPWPAVIRALYEGGAG